MSCWELCSSSWVLSRAPMAMTSGSSWCMGSTKTKTKTHHPSFFFKLKPSCCTNNINGPTESSASSSLSSRAWYNPLRRTHRSLDQNPDIVRHWIQPDTPLASPGTNIYLFIFSLEYSFILILWGTSLFMCVLNYKKKRWDLYTTLPVTTCCLSFIMKVLWKLKISWTWHFSIIKILRTNKEKNEKKKKRIHALTWSILSDYMFNNRNLWTVVVYKTMLTIYMI